MLTNSTYLQLCHCAIFNIDFYITDVKMTILKAWFLVVINPLSLKY